MKRPSRKSRPSARKPSLNIPTGMTRPTMVSGERIQSMNGGMGSGMNTRLVLQKGKSYPHDTIKKLQLEGKFIQGVGYDSKTKQYFINYKESQPRVQFFVNGKPSTTYSTYEGIQEIKETSKLLEYQNKGKTVTATVDGKEVYKTQSTLSHHNKNSYNHSSKKMIYEKDGFFVTRLKGESEAYFKTKEEAIDYQNQYKKFEELKAMEDEQKYIKTNTTQPRGETVQPAKPKLTPQQKILQPFTKEKWEEKDVQLALRRINSGKITPKEIFNVNKNLDSGEGVSLTQSQSDKGFTYLKGLHYTPKGKEKESSPYGSREVFIIDNPKYIYLIDFYSERGRYYVPLYRAVARDGTSMDYYGSGGKINIIG
jgi:hypothetical protein